MDDVAPWLRSVPLLTEQMQEEVSSAYRRGLMSSPLPVVLLDLEGRILAVNAEAERLAGREAMDLHGLPVQQFVHEEDRLAVGRVLARLAAGTTRRADLESRWMQLNGRVGWCRLHAFRVDDQDSGLGCTVVLVEDITDERFAQRQGAALVDVGRLITAGASLSVLAQRLADVADDRWVGAGCLLTLLDESGETLVPVAHGRLPEGYIDSLPRIVAGEDGAACGSSVLHDARVAIPDLVDDPRAVAFRPLLQSFGIVAGWSVPVRDPAGRIIGAFGLFHTTPIQPGEHDWQVLELLAGVAGIACFVDTERRRHDLRQQELRHDALTRLPNTVALLDTALPLCAESASLSMAVIRLHEMGDVSTVLGDHSASLVLRSLADRAAALGDVRSVALVGSMTLAVAASGEWGRHELDLLARILRRPLQIGALSVRPQVRIGLSTKPVGRTVTPEALLRQATVAVPPVGVATYDSEVAHDNVALFALAAEVGRALRHGEFVVHYQPQYELGDGSLVGSEALVRWQHPDRGLLSPGTLLPAVQRAAAGPDLALQVLRRVLADRPQREARGLRGRVAVNLTAEDVSSDDVVEFLCDPDETRWRHLEIELTETSLADPRCLAALERLAAVGYPVALDDFGTGYSSLSALHRLPLHSVKIDRSFVQRLPDDRAAHALVGAVAAMCSQLGMRVVAEGIETPEQAAAALDLGCATGQGFLLRRPLPLAELDGSAAVIAP